MEEKLYHHDYGMATTRRTFLGVATALTVSICLAAGAVRAERTWKIPEGFQWGVTFGFYATNGYFSSSVAKDEIEAIARAGATWVTVVPTVWQDEGRPRSSTRTSRTRRTTSSSWKPSTSSMRRA